MVVDEASHGWREALDDWLVCWEKESLAGGLWSKNQITDFFTDSCGRAFGSMAGGRLESVLLFRHTADIAEVDFLATLPSCRGRGQMISIFNKLQNRQDIREIWLEVHQNNSRAINFYQKIGMKNVGIRTKYYSDGGNCFLFTLKK